MEELFQDLLQQLTDFLLTRATYWILGLLIIGLASYTIYRMVKMVLRKGKIDVNAGLRGLGLKNETEKKKKQKKKG